MGKWLPGARVHDLSGQGIGNGPFGTFGFLGVVLHVNVDEQGTPASFWGPGNPGQVCPNFQVFKDGSVDQMLPINWQPWCQVDGNNQYAAIETAGLPSEPLTDAQIAACARILAAYVHELGLRLAVVDVPGQRGLITHSAGGASWGGHSCPGSIRAAQRGAIVAAAHELIAPAPPAVSDLLERIAMLPGAPAGLTYQQFVHDVAVAVWGVDAVPAPSVLATPENPTWAPGQLLKVVEDGVIAIARKVGVPGA